MHEGDYRELHDTEMAKYRAHLKEPMGAGVIRAHIEILQNVIEGKPQIYKEVVEVLSLDTFVNEAELKSLVKRWNSSSTRRDETPFRREMFVVLLGAMSRTSDSSVFSQEIEKYALHRQKL